jgi:hypothetical protein
VSAGPTNAAEAFYLDSDLDRVAAGGRWRLGILKHATGVAGTLPYEDGSLPSTLTEITAAGYASPVINDSGVSAVSEWNPAIPGNPTVKVGPASGQWSFGTFTAAPVTAPEACTCIVIMDRVVRTGVSITTVQGSSTVTVAGTTVTNADLGRRLPTALGIPAGCVIGQIIDSTHFTISKANAAVTADSANGTTPGTASHTLGEAIRYALPYWDPAATYPSPPNVTTVNGSDVATFASALTNGRLYEGATITGPGISGGTTLLSVSADGLTALLSAPAGAGAGTDVCTITGRVTTKAFTTNDNPVIDPTYPLPVKTGKPKDAF